MNPKTIVEIVREAEHLIRIRKPLMPLINDNYKDSRHFYIDFERINGKTVKLYRNDVFKYRNREKIRKIREMLIKNTDTKKIVKKLKFPSYDSLRCFFEKHTGETVREFLTDYRVSKIEEVLDSGKTVKDAASVIGYRPSSVCHLLKNKTGRNLHESFIDYRISKVIRLLKSGRSMKDAASAINCRPTSAYRLLKNKTGHSPDYYRCKSV